MMNYFSVLFICLFTMTTLTNATFFNTGGINNLINPLKVGGGCPLCDSSVYSYCSDKMFHDACCCNVPLGQGAGIGLSYQCQYADCSFVYANTCYEHTLITTCCCNSPYRKL